MSLHGLTPPPRPNPTAPAAPAKKLSIGPIFSSSDVNFANDGTLCAGGIADAAAGDVTVTITSPGGGAAQLVVSVDALDSELRACFSTLAEGNYTVDATQADGQSVNAAIGVP